MYCAHETVSAGGSDGFRLGGSSRGSTESLGAARGLRGGWARPPPSHFVSHSPSVCSWRDLKTTICFYLVLFYTTLILLSRQVRLGQPPVLHLERERGGARLPQGEQCRRQGVLGEPWSCLPASPTSGPPATLPALSPGPWLPCCLQIDYYCRLDCLWKNKFKKEHEEFETMENVNRLLLENVLPAHVAAHFIGDKLNEVSWPLAGGRCKVRGPSCTAMVVNYKPLSQFASPRAPETMCAISCGTQALGPETWVTRTSLLWGSVSHP